MHKGRCGQGMCLYLPLGLSVGLPQASPYFTSLPSLNCAEIRSLSSKPIPSAFMLGLNQRGCNLCNEIKQLLYRSQKGNSRWAYGSNKRWVKSCREVMRCLGLRHKAAHKALSSRRGINWLLLWLHLCLQLRWELLELSSVFSRNSCLDDEWMDGLFSPT